MIQFWLDTDMFIEARNGAYGFDIAPGFWKLIDDQSDRLVIASSTLVYEELVEHSSDDLATWARARRNKAIWVPPDREVQTAYTEVASYVASTYPTAQAAKSLKGADLWLIAHAKSKGRRVVTLEVLVNPQSMRLTRCRDCLAGRHRLLDP